MSKLAKVTKTWLFENGQLYDFEHERLVALKELGLQLRPKVRVRMTVSKIIIDQHFFSEEFNNYKHLSENMIKKLCELLDYLHTNNLVHGDLCRSNIGVTKKNELLLFDWEPKLLLTQSQTLTFRSSKYCLHPADRNIQKVTCLSDRLAFASLFLQARKGRYRGLGTLKSNFNQIINSCYKVSSCSALCQDLEKI